MAASAVESVIASFRFLTRAREALEAILGTGSGRKVKPVQPRRHLGNKHSPEDRGSRDDVANDPRALADGRPVGVVGTVDRFVGSAIGSGPVRVVGLGYCQCRAQRSAGLIAARANGAGRRDQLGQCGDVRPAGLLEQ